MDPVDIAILVLRLGLVAALYLFLLVILRASRQTLATANAPPAAPAARAPLLRLVVVDPGETGLRPGATIDARDGALVGRAEDADIRILDPTVSSKHARIVLAQGAWRLDDLGSTNGTSVNGERVIGRATISPGDEVALGTSRFRVGGDQ